MVEHRGVIFSQRRKVGKPDLHNKIKTKNDNPGNYVKETEAKLRE